MHFFRQIDRPTLLLLSLLLSLSLLFAQEVGLHSHSFDHVHGDNHVNVIDDTTKYSHLNSAHFALDASHNDHHHGAIAEIDVSPDGLLKSVNNTIVSIALIILLFLLVMPTPSRKGVHRHRESKLILHKHYILSPPLRAPPPY